MSESPTTLGEITKQVTKKVQVSNLDLETYISTDNMLPNLGGIEKASGMPSIEKAKEFIVGDVLFSNIRTYFKKVWYAKFDGGCSNDVLVFRSNKSVNSRFLYYVLADNNFIDYTVQTAKGTKMPRGDKDAIIKYALNLPPLPEQKAIAHILGKLDDKIELNRQMNQTLETMAQALFKSWFVDFDPVLDNALESGSEIPDSLQAMAEKRRVIANREERSGKPASPAGGQSHSKRLIKTNPALAAQFPSAFVFNEVLDKWIPEGWGVKKLQEVVNVKYGKDHKKLGEGEIPCFGSGGVMRYVNEALFEFESVLIPRKGTLNNVMYLNKPFWSVDTMFYTETNQEKFVKYFFYVMNRLNFSEMNEGSAVPSMTTAQLNSMDILLPSLESLTNFDSLVSKYFFKKDGNETQSESLTQLRDRLLPELISGRVRVPSLEEQTGQELGMVAEERGNYNLKS